MDNRFLEIMRVRVASIPYMEDEELATLTKDIEKYRSYFRNGEKHGYTKLFTSSVNGKLGAINDALVKTQSPNRV